MHLTLISAALASRSSPCSRIIFGFAVMIHPSVFIKWITLSYTVSHDICFKWPIPRSVGIGNLMIPSAILYQLSNKAALSDESFLHWFLCRAMDLILESPVFVFMIWMPVVDRRPHVFDERN